MGISKVISKKVERPVILGVVGDSATGKTTLAAGIARILGEDRCTVICTDDYHSLDREQRQKLDISALNPKANYMDILQQHLKLLRQGKPVLKPVYDHKTGVFKPVEYVIPKDYLILEGLLGYTTREMRDCYDVKIFLNPADELRFNWKEHRDVSQRGYSQKEVRESLKRRKKDSAEFIDPQRVFADMVISFEKPERDDLEGEDKSSEAKVIQNGDNAHLNVRHILRPTLPHPDFSPLFEEGSSKADDLFLELVRDADGKPVDVLKISGGISDRCAERMEDLMWDHIPEAGDMREQVGKIDDIDGPQISHPLALTQLMVAYHMVKAGLDVHAV